MCVCLPVSGGKNRDQIMRWFPKTHSVTARTLDSVAYCYVYPLSLTAFLIPVIATTQVHLRTQASPVSFPSSPTATRGHSPTWALLIFVPAYLLPIHTPSTFRLWSYYMPISPPLLLLLLPPRKSSRVAQS